MIMVRVQVKPGEFVVGLLIDTQLVPVAGAVVTPGQQQVGLQAFGVVAVENRFVVGPLDAMRPMVDEPITVQDGEEESDEQSPGPAAGAVEVEGFGTVSEDQEKPGAV